MKVKTLPSKPKGREGLQELSGSSVPIFQPQPRRSAPNFTSSPLPGSTTLILGFGKVDNTLSDSLCTQ